LADALFQGPTAGIKPLREAVANLYNEHHRKGKESQYTWENVCIVPGGRAGLIRIAAVIGKYSPNTITIMRWRLKGRGGKRECLPWLLHTRLHSLQRDAVLVP
jgi:hypothetical protein